MRNRNQTVTGNAEPFTGVRSATHSDIDAATESGTLEHVETPTTFAARLALAMDLRGIGRRELEIGASLSRGYVSRMIAGTRVPRVGGSALVRIAKFLRVRWRWLGVGAGPMEKFVASGVKQRASAAEIAIAYNRSMVSDEAVAVLRAEAEEWGAEREWGPPQWGRRLLEIQAELTAVHLSHE